MRTRQCRNVQGSAAVSMRVQSESGVYISPYNLKHI
jgi:hypothetical protein